MTEDLRKKENKARSKGRYQEEDVEKKKREALKLLSKGLIGKSVDRMTSFGTADQKDPKILDLIRSKYPGRGKPLPRFVPKAQCVDNLKGLQESWLNLKPGVSPGPGGLRGEFLTTLAEVWEPSDFLLMEQFGLQYFNGSLPPWLYTVWLSIQTVPIFKTAERDTVRPLSLQNPLVRSLNR